MKIKLLVERPDFGKIGEIVEVNQYTYEYLKELGHAELFDENEKQPKKQKNEKD